MTQDGQQGMQQGGGDDEGPVYAPELDGGVWLQGGPVKMRGTGSPILIDFWDYTCVNCVRTLPYVTEWHRRYEQYGLTVVGVHTPEFSFARNPDHVKAAIAHLALDYPIVLDAEYEIWKGFANHYWPAKYFIDGEGKIRARHYGEGGYVESEQLIQFMLAEQEGFDAALPEVMEPVRAEDVIGAVCYRVTPELYCGYARGLVGNVGALVPDRQTHRGHTLLRGRLAAAAGERLAAVRREGDEPHAPGVHGGGPEPGAAPAADRRDGRDSRAARRAAAGRARGRGRARRRPARRSPGDVLADQRR